MFYPWQSWQPDFARSERPRPPKQNRMFGVAVASIVVLLLTGVCIGACSPWFA